MGSNDFYPEEFPIKEINIASFLIDEHPVTNTQFSKFIETTQYITVAERGNINRAKGSFVFNKPNNDIAEGAWWVFEPNTKWFRPDGLNILSPKQANYPVVHIAFEDALIYAQWCGKTLPTEAQYEYAALGKRPQHDFSQQHHLVVENKRLANVWLGKFPRYLDENDIGGTTSVKTYPANAYHLFDMIGNVWEWTKSPSFLSTPQHKSCCGKQKSIDDSYILKGGSFLCSPYYCKRYRPSATIIQNKFETTNHIGFRCVNSV